MQFFINTCFSSDNSLLILGFHTFIFKFFPCFRLMLLLVLLIHGNNLSAHVKLDRQPRFHFLNNATTLSPPLERKSKQLEGKRFVL